MPTDDSLVEIPIYVGMGESGEDHNRTGKSVLSENTRFLKEGSVATVPPLVEEWETTYTNIRLLPTVDTLYSLDERALSRLDAGGTVTELEGILRPYAPGFREVSLGRPCIAWPQAVLCGEHVVVTWLEVVPEHGYLPFIATLDKEGRILSEPAQVLAAGAPADMPVCPKYSLVRLGDNDVIISCVSAPDANLSPPVTMFQVRYSRSVAGSPSFLPTSDVFTGSIGGSQAAYIASCYDGSNMHHVTYSAPATQSDPWTDGVTRHWVIGADGTLVSNRDLASAYSASSFAALAAHPTTDEVWMVFRGYDRTEAWLVDIEPATLAAPTQLNGSHPWFKTAEPTASFGNEVEVHPLAFRHFSRLEDAFIFFEDTGVGNIVVQGQGSEGVNQDTRNLTGMSLWRLGTSVFTGGVPATFPNLSFTGGAFVDNTDLCVPAVERLGWHSLFIESGLGEGDAVETSTPVEMWYRGQTVGGYPVPSQVAITNRPLSQPSYAVNCIAAVDLSGNQKVHTFHSFDEATDHTGLIHHPEGTSYSATIPAFPANYRCLMGSVIDDGGEYYVLTSKQSEARLVGGDGTGGYEAEDVRLEGWGCAINFLKLESSKNPQATYTTQRAVVGHDLVSVLAGTDILPTALPIPPIATLPFFTGTGADTVRRRFAFCWAFIDEEGIRHRGPLSPTYVVRDTSVGKDTDEGEFRVMVPGSFFSVPEGRFLLEVYADAIESGAVQEQLVLTDTLELPSPPFTSASAASIRVPYSYNNTAPALPVPYTTGGVLPNEARPTTGKLTFNRQRVWSFDDKRLFFSKQEGYKRPFAFNSNLYFDSPDGSRFTGVASLDEQTVAFTRTGVFMNRGTLPNDLGAGGNTVLHMITSPTGCVNPESVVESPYGVFFQGERGLYLLQRNFQVDYIGFDIEESLGSALVEWAFYDRGNNEVVFAVGGDLYVYNTLMAQWCKRTPSESVGHGAWHPSYGAIYSRSNQVFTETREVDDNTILFPLKHSTPWISLNTLQGFQRCKRFLLQGKWSVGNRYFPPVFSGETEIEPERTEVEDRTQLTVRAYVDHETTPSTERVFELTQYSQDPLEIKLPIRVQKCRAIRFELETEDSNLDLTITSAVALIGVKRLENKRPNSPGV